MSNSIINNSLSSIAMLEVLSAEIRDGMPQYEGWVAYVDGAPIFEAVPHNAGLAAVLGGRETVRPADRNTLDWKMLPMAKVQRVELYFARDYYVNQPVVKLDRLPGTPNLVFLQSKQRALVADAGSGALSGQVRTQVQFYRVGYWNPDRPACELIEVSRQGVERLGTRRHPCWPEPFGFGIAPWVVGLTEEQVPPVQ